MDKSSANIRLSGTNLERAADHNQRVTLHAIRVHESLTRIDIANITGLTAPAIANITRRLLGDGIILEAGRRRGARGQPPTNLMVNPNAAFAIGINIDRDHITMVLVNFLGQTIARASREVDFALPQQVRAFFLGKVEALLDQPFVERSRIVGIGVATPDDLGSINLPGRPEAYTQWNDTDLAALFEGVLDVPVFVENDAAAAAMGEQQLGHGQNVSSFFYILISSALGGGLVIDGSYFRGAAGRSGELGFLRVERGSGKRTQIQHLVSLSALAEPLREAGLTVEDLLRSDGSDPALEALMTSWIDEAALRLVEPTIAVNCLINPAAVLIGGRLPARHVDRLAERLCAALQVEGANVPVIAPVKRAMLAEDAPAVGAAILPFSHFLLPKSSALWKERENAEDPAAQAG